MAKNKAVDIWINTQIWNNEDFHALSIPAGNLWFWRVAHPWGTKQYASERNACGNGSSSLEEIEAAWQELDDSKLLERSDLFSYEEMDEFEEEE